MQTSILELCTVVHTELTYSEYGGLSSVGRASGCGSECRGFEPRSSPQIKKLRPVLSFFIWLYQRVAYFFLNRIPPTVVINAAEASTSAKILIGEVVVVALLAVCARSFDTPVTE
jgi:hypothetical protein